MPTLHQSSLTLIGASPVLVFGASQIQPFPLPEHMMHEHIHTAPPTALHPHHPAPPCATLHHPAQPRLLSVHLPATGFMHLLLMLQTHNPCSHKERRASGLVRVKQLASKALHRLHHQTCRWQPVWNDGARLLAQQSIIWGGPTEVSAPPQPGSLPDIHTGASCQPRHSRHHASLNCCVGSHQPAVSI